MTEVVVTQFNSRKKIIPLMDLDSEVDGEISLMFDETLAQLERQKDMGIGAAQKGRESSLLEQIKELRTPQHFNLSFFTSSMFFSKSFSYALIFNFKFSI